MVPMVALIGRPNIGKFTLSNYLARIRDTLIADFPGLIHDHKYGCVEIEGREFTCIDIGGIDGTEDGVETRMAEQSLLATKEADVVLFMVDACLGLMPADGAIAKHLCSREKPTFLVASKTNGLDPDQVMAGFYALGPGETYPVAAFHGRGVLSLSEHVLPPQMEDLAPQEEVDKDAEYWAQFEVEENGEEEEEDDFDSQSLPIELATVGHPNVGRSTFTNRVLGEERIIVYDAPGTTHNSIYTPVERDGREYVLIDTVGICKRSKITNAVEKFLIIRMLQTTEGINVAMLVIDAHEGISDQDLPLLGFVLSSGRSLVIAMSKWDGLSQGVKEQTKETLDFRLGSIDFICVYFISTLHGNGVGSLLEPVYETYDSSTHCVGASMLMYIIAMVIEDHQPSLVRGRRVELEYAHAGGYSPPIAVIHGNQVKDLSDFHKRYLVNYLHESLDVVGSSIRTQLREGENPHVNRCNILTPIQTRKRERLMKYIKKNRQLPVWFPSPHREGSRMTREEYL